MNRRVATIIFSESSKKCGADYVVSLEKMDFMKINKHLTDVALQAINDDFNSKSITFDEWKQLERRIAVIQERLIEADRWHGYFD